MLEEDTSVELVEFVVTSGDVYIVGGPGELEDSTLDVEDISSTDVEVESKTDVEELELSDVEVDTSSSSSSVVVVMAGSISTSLEVDGVG